MKHLKLLFICMATVGLLAGCSTPTKKNEAENNPSTDEKAMDNEQPKTDNADKENGEDRDQEESETDKSRPLEKNLTYLQNGNQAESLALLSESDNQGYSLYMLEDYELTGEEPRKDVLYLKEDDSLFMRIELLPSDSNMDQEIQTAKDQLKSIDDSITEPEALKRQQWLKNTESFSASNGADQASIYLVPQDDWLLKLTIFTPADEEAEDPFLSMAETIDHP